MSGGWLREGGAFWLADITVPLGIHWGWSRGAVACGRGLGGCALGMLRAGQQCGNVIWGGSGGQGVDLKTLLWWKLGGIGLGSPVLGVLWELLNAQNGGGIELWLGCKETVLCVRFLCKNHPLTLPSWEPLRASLGSRQSCRLLPGGPCEGRAGGLPAPAGGTVRAQPRAHSAAAALKAAVGRAGPVPGGGDARV